MIKDRLSLDDVEWGEFRIKDLFDVMGTVTTHPTKLLYNGETPRITCAGTNNGLDNFYNNEPTENGGTLTIDSATEGFVFFQEKPFIATDHVEKICRKDNKLITKEIGLFLKSAIDKAKDQKYGYGYKFSQTRIKNQIIMLPIDKNGEPNWQFMEDYIKQEQKIIAQKLINYYEDKIIKTGFDLLGLEDLKWHSFKIKDIFEIRAVKGKTLSSYPDGKTPYVSTSSLNNGISGYIDSKDDISNEKCISIDPIAGKAFYHNYKFVGRGGAGSAINLLYNQNLDENNAQFILTMIEKVSREKASYGVALNGERLKNMRLTLPVDKKGEPHWDYMSKFMQKIEQEKLEKALNYIYIYSLAICEARKLPKLEEKEWGEFWLEDIVDIKSGIDIYEKERIDGNIPYITAKSVDNGIGYFVSNTNKTLESDCISINRNGSVGYAFYHPYPALFGNDTRKLVQKNKNKYNSIFMTRCLINQKEKYGYGYKMGTERLKRQKLLLPVNKLGKPDYSYMKKYMQIEEIKQAYKIVDYYIKSIQA